MVATGSMRRAGIALLSASIVAYQIALMHLLSNQQGHHFAYLVISMALLGFGASGTLLAILRPWFERHSKRLFPLCAALSALTMVSGPPLVGADLARFEAHLLFSEPLQLPALAWTYLVYALPFFLGALVVGLAFLLDASRASSLYAANLAGSALGGPLALLLLSVLHPAHVPIASALPVALSVPLFVSKNRLVRSGALAVPVAVVIALIWLPAHVPISEYKDLSRALLLPGAEVVAESPGPLGHLQLVTAPALRHAPGLSLHYPGEIPVNPTLFSNGDWFGTVPESSVDESPPLLEYTTSALAFAAARVDHVLVLESRTGTFVQHALRRGASEVTAVETRNDAVRLVGAHTGALGPYADPRVHVDFQFPRVFLARSDATYDVILWPTVGSFGGSTGLSAMEEQYLLTREAFAAAFDRLAPGGRIAVTVWLDYPYRLPLRLAHLMTSELDRRVGEKVSDHLAAVLSWGTITFVASRDALDESFRSSQLLLCDSLGFDPLLVPGVDQAIPSVQNTLQDSTLFDLLTAVVAGDEERLARYPFDVFPPSDDRPYFSQMMRLPAFLALLRQRGTAGAALVEMGIPVALLGLGQATLLSLLLILLPLGRMAVGPVGRVRTLLYFGALGGGYMMVEIVLLQRLTLLLGHPLYAASAVLGTLLLFSGLGSLATSSFTAERRTLRRASLTVVAVLACYLLFLPSLTGPVLGLAPLPRIAVALLLVAIPGFVMGMPFPLALTRLNLIDRSVIPWAWGVNGCLSVIGANAAALVSVRLGFSVLIGLSAVLYLVAALSVPASRTAPPAINSA